MVAVPAICSSPLCRYLSVSIIP